MQNYYPLNYEINYYGKIYNFNATELAWLSALLTGGSRVFNKLDSSNSDLQVLNMKGLVDENGMLTRDGIFLAQYVTTVHPNIQQNPIYSLTYDYIVDGDDTLGVDMRTKHESIEPKYNFQKRIKNFFEKQQTKNFVIESIEPIDLDETMPVTLQEPFKDIVKTNSSFIKGLGYDNKTEQLDLHLSNGQIYRYLDVPSMVFNALRTADTRIDSYSVQLKSGADMKKASVGSYYAKLIKNNYKAIRIK